MNNVVDIASKLNGGDRPSPVDPDVSKQVYGCGYCEDQGHRLLPEGEIICGQCSKPSAFLHYEPEKLRAGDAKRMPKLMESRADRLDNYVCSKCRHNRFHLHPSGTVTCYRCRHAAAVKWWNPTEE